MQSHVCAICIETFDPREADQSVHLEYVTTAGNESFYPEVLDVCDRCVPGLREVIDHWNHPTLGSARCAHCGDISHDGTRIDTTIVTRRRDGFTQETPVYDLCTGCDGVFENFLELERRDEFEPPSGWDVLGPTGKRIVGVRHDDFQLTVAPATVRSDRGVVASVGETLQNPGCYAVAMSQSSRTNDEDVQLLCGFEDVSDAVEFLRLVVEDSEASANTGDGEVETPPAWIDTAEHDDVPLYTDTAPEDVVATIFEENLRAT